MLTLTGYNVIQVVVPQIHERVNWRSVKRIVRLHKGKICILIVYPTRYAENRLAPVAFSLIS